MRIRFTVPVVHALTVGIRDGEHYFDIDPSTIDPSLRARLLACYKAGSSPDHIGKVEPLGSDLESFIAAHERRRDTEAQAAAEAQEAEEAHRLDRQRRDADTAAGVAAALAAYLALPEGETFDVLSLPSTVQSALHGSRAWRAERERREAFRAAKKAAEQAALEKATQAVVRGLLVQSPDETIVERFDAGLLSDQEEMMACDQALFGRYLCALDTSQLKCARREQDTAHTATQWVQRKALIAHIERLALEGWTFQHSPICLGKDLLPGRYVQATYMGDPGMSYSVDLAYTAEDFSTLKDE